MIPLLTKTWHLASKLLALNIAAVREHRERQNYLRMPDDYWERLPDVVFQQHEPVFFLSTGRCGTQFLTEVLAEEEGLLCHHAPQPQLLFSDRKAYEEGREQFEAYKIAIRATRFELIADCIVRQRRYVETNCRVTFFASHLASLFPRARFVHLVRHPGAFIRSGIRRGYYQGCYDDIGRIRPCQGEAAAAWPSLDPFERCAWLWNETNSFIEDAKTRMDEGQVLTVRSEDLFTSPEGLLSVYDHCGFSRPSAARISSWIQRKVNEQRGGAEVTHHQSWDEPLREKVRRWTPLAARYNYDL